MVIKNKKGVSEIISYVLLIIIAVSISVLVYNYLLKYIPKGEVSECPEGISVIIQESDCTEGQLSMTLSNRGLWNVSAVSIKIGLVGSKVKSPIGSETNPYIFDSPLAPSAMLALPAFTTEVSGNSELEIVPIIYDKKDKQVICSKAIITQPLICQ